MNNYIQIKNYFFQQEVSLQQIRNPADRKAIVRLTLQKALETAVRDEIDVDENRELIVFAEKHRTDLPFQIPSKFTKENSEDFLKQLRPSDSSGFSALFRILPPPFAIIKDTIFSLGGHTVHDSYADLENPENHQTLRFKKEQQDYSDQILTNLPGVEELRKRLTLLREGLVSKIEETITTPHGIYFTRLSGAAGVSSLYWRPNPSSKDEKLLVDPASFDTPDKKHLIVGVYPSPTGKLIAIRLFINSNARTQEIKIVDTQHNPPRVIETISHTSLGATWLPDESGLIYVRHPDQIKEMWEDQQVRLHHLGEKQEKDRLLVGIPSTSASYKIESDYFPYIYTAPKNSNYFIVSLEKGTDHAHHTIIVASIDDLQKPIIPWKEVSSVKGTKVTDFALQGDQLYLHVTENPYGDPSKPEDSNGMILKVSLKDPNPNIKNRRASSIFVPASDKILYPHFAAQADGLYLFEQDVALRRPVRISYANPTQQDYFKDLPVGDAGNSSLRNHLDPRMRGATFNVTQWGGEASICYFDEPSKMTQLQLEEKSPLLSVNIKSKVIFGTNEDGSRLPITLLYDKDHEPTLNGKSKLHVEGYAAYGSIYSPAWVGSSIELRHRALIEKGWVIAIIHAQGGGEQGDLGHQKGRLENKNNSQKGFVRGIRHLHQLGYSSPDYTAINGLSAGGFVVGWAITEKERLARAFTMHSAVFDGLRLFFGGAGKVNTPEFGDPRITEQFSFVERNSPYRRISPGKRYPDGLLIYDGKDTNVDHFHFLKAVAALRASNSHNVALSMQTSCGHVYTGCEEQEIIEKEAQIVAWLEWEMGKNKK